MRLFAVIVGGEAREEPSALGLPVVVAKNAPPKEREGGGYEGEFATLWVAKTTSHLLTRGTRIAIENPVVRTRPRKGGGVWTDVGGGKILILEKGLPPPCTEVLESAAEVPSPDDPFA